MFAFLSYFFKKKSVLVIEDDASLRDILHERLSAEGFRVFVAVNGQEGLSAALQKHPDVILLDLLLPERDGISVLEELRKDEWGKDAKVIIMSNIVEGVGLMDQARRHKVAGYIEKVHFSLDELAEKIKKSI